jgi:uncharacterized BrkB/YihY/UPF0761 family membrane protein
VVASSPQAGDGADPADESVVDTGVSGGGRIAGMRSSIQATWTRIEASRDKMAGVDVTFVAVGHDRRVGGNLLACALAYRLFLWLLPVSLLIAGVLGFVQGSGPGDPAEVARDVGLGGYVASTVAEAADQASSSWWALVALALFGLYTTSSGGAKAFRIVHSLIWGVPASKPRRSWFPPLGFFVVATGALLLSIAADTVRSDDFRLLSRLAVLFVFGGFGLAVSLLLPHGDASWRDLVPGALVLAVGLQALHLFTVYYLVDRVSHSSELYGGLGSAATILLWLYLIGRLTVAAAVLNVSLQNRRRELAG